MKGFFIFLGFIASVEAHSFTLWQSHPHLLPSGVVPLHVMDDRGGESDCGHFKMSKKELLELAVEASDQYWNQAEANIRFVKGSIGHSLDTQSLFIGCWNNPNAEDMGYISAHNHHIIYLGKEFEELTKQEQMQIMAHGIGHALGIGHSSAMNALMRPLDHQLAFPDLSQDDIFALQYLYGTR